MKAAVFEGIERKLRIQEVDVPSIGQDEALLKVAYTGLCHTDVKKVWYNILGLGQDDPRVFGHEIVGEIVDLGKDVTSTSIGDRVAIFHHVPCEDCEPCSNGKYAQCDTYKSVDTGAGYGQASGGGFAEYIKIPSLVLAKGTIPIPNNVSYEEAVFVEPLNCALKAIQLLEQHSSIQESEPVLIVGQGHQGLIFDQLVSLYGGKPIATDKRRSRVAKGNEFAEAYTPREIKKLADRIGGFSKSIICAANYQAVDLALSMMKDNGVSIYFGDLVPKKGKVDLNHHSRNEIPFGIDGKLVVPSYSSSFVLHQEAANLIFDGKVDVDSMVTQKIGLSDLESAIGGAVKGTLRKGLFRREEVLKILVSPRIEEHSGYTTPSWNRPLAAIVGLVGLTLIGGLGIQHHLKFSDYETPVTLIQARDTISRMEAEHLKSLPFVPGFTPTSEYGGSLCIDLDGQAVCKTIVE